MSTLGLEALCWWALPDPGPLSSKIGKFPDSAVFRPVIPATWRAPSDTPFRQQLVEWDDWPLTILYEEVVVIDFDVVYTYEPLTTVSRWRAKPLVS